MTRCANGRQISSWGPSCRASALWPGEPLLPLSGHDMCRRDQRTNAFALENQLHSEHHSGGPAIRPAAVSRRLKSISYQTSASAADNASGLDHCGPFPRGSVLLGRVARLPGVQSAARAGSKSPRWRVYSQSWASMVRAMSLAGLPVRSAIAYPRNCPGGTAPGPPRTRQHDGTDPETQLGR